MLIFSPQTPRPDIRSCCSGNGNLVCVNCCRCVCVGVTRFRSCCHQVNAVGNHGRGCCVPECVGVDMGQAIVPAEVIQPSGNAGRMEPFPVIFGENHSGFFPARPLLEAHPHLLQLPRKMVSTYLHQISQCDNILAAYVGYGLMTVSGSTVIRSCFSACIFSENMIREQDAAFLV